MLSISLRLTVLFNVLKLLFGLVTLLEIFEISPSALDTLVVRPETGTLWHWIDAVSNVDDVKSSKYIAPAVQIDGDLCVYNHVFEFAFQTHEISCQDVVNGP